MVERSFLPCVTSNLGCASPQRLGSGAVRAASGMSSGTNSSGGQYLVMPQPVLVPRLGSTDEDRYSRFPSTASSSFSRCAAHLQWRLYMRLQSVSLHLS